MRFIFTMSFNQPLVVTESTIDTVCHHTCTAQLITQPLSPREREVSYVQLIVRCQALHIILNWLFVPVAFGR